jgi:hypothetical protein
MGANKKLSIAKFAALCGVASSTMHDRLARGMSVRESVAVLTRSEATARAWANRPLADHKLAQRAFIMASLPAGYAEIGEALGLGRGGARHHVTELQMEGLVHIGSWRRTVGRGGKFAPVFHAGAGVDVPCKLKALTDKEYSRRWRKLHRNDESMDRKRASDRQRHWDKKAKTIGIAADPLMAALFGKTP